MLFLGATAYLLAVSERIAEKHCQQHPGGSNMKRIVVGLVLVSICAWAAGADEEAIHIGARLELLMIF